MPIAQESIDNFNRAAEGDSLLGIVNLADNQAYLALARRLDEAEISRDRYSTIAALALDPLEGAGGHAVLARAAGLTARQLGPGNAEGRAYGFSLVKTRPPETFVIGSFRSGFNGQYAGSRPAFATADDRQERRTLTQERIMSTGVSTDDLYSLLSPLRYGGSSIRRRNSR